MVNPVSLSGSLPLLAVAPAPKPAPSRTASVSVPAVPSSTAPAAAVAQVNQHLAQAQTELRLQVDNASGRTVFQVVQQGSGHVVLQVPSEEVLGMSRRVRELEGQTAPSGALVDKQG